MALSTVRYIPAPKGFLNYEEGPDGYPTRRNSEAGPYGIFIQPVYEAVKPCKDWSEIEREYMPIWRRADEHMKSLLWGSDEEIQRATLALQALNEKLFHKGSSALEGLLQIENWSSAGIQLKSAVRDYHIYGSTARFEDVRDFIWERITLMKYPHSWRITRDEFKRQVNIAAPVYERRERDLDPEDSVFQEWQLENPPARRSTITEAYYCTASTKDQP
ncbi:hypothetical protein BJX65DRAFT_300850 [Aspergillus insuetus]